MVSVTVRDRASAASQQHRLTLACRQRWRISVLHTKSTSSLKLQRYNHTYMLFQYSIFIRRLVRSHIYAYDETIRDEKLHKLHRNECNCASESVTCVHMAQTADTWTVLRFAAETKHAIVRFCSFSFLSPSRRLLKQIDWENRCTAENDTIENESLSQAGWPSCCQWFYSLSRCCSKWMQRVAAILWFADQSTHRTEIVFPIQAHNDDPNEWFTYTGPTRRTHFIAFAISALSK